jgi:hypothetical protein
MQVCLPVSRAFAVLSGPNDPNYPERPHRLAVHAFFSDRMQPVAQLLVRTAA